MTFEAALVEAYETTYTANLFLADPEADPRRVLSLCRRIDRSVDEYYFEINDQANSAYNGLESAHLFRDRIEVRVQQKVIEKFGDLELAHVTASFKLADAEFAQVLAMARRIFEISPETLSIDPAIADRT